MATVGVKGLTINCYVHVDVEPITLTQFIYTDAQKKNTHIKKKTDDEDNRRIYKQIMYTDMQSSTKYSKKLHDDDDRPIL